MDNENKTTDVTFEDQDAAPQAAEGRSRKKKALPPGTLKAEILSWIQILVTAACIAFVLNTFIIANSKVPSGSMENTIMTDDRVIGSRLNAQLPIVSPIRRGAISPSSVSRTTSLSTM